LNQQPPGFQLLDRSVLLLLYKHEGEPFLGPDGGALTIHGQVFGGGKNVPAGMYPLDNVDSASNYNEWVSDTLFCGNLYHYNEKFILRYGKVS
jgi:hypothetical protein